MAIWRIKNIEGLEILFKQLESHNKYTRRNVAKALCETRDARVLEPLLTAIKDDKTGIQEVAIPELGKFENRVAIDFLIELLKNENEQMRYYAARGLRHSESKRATDALLRALKDEYWNVRWCAIEEMGERKEKRSVEPLINILANDDRERVCDSAARALGEIKDARAVEPLINALENGSAHVRSSAAYSLGQIGDKRAVKPLIASLNDKDFYVRARSAQALGSLEATEATQPLIEALKSAQKDKFGNVRNSAARALEKITGNEFGTSPDKWEKWWNETRNRVDTDSSSKVDVTSLDGTRHEVSNPTFSYHYVFDVEKK